MPTIAVTNQKGGTAKTTTAINLSAALAQAGERVLLVDLDPQGSTTAGLGLDIYDLELSVYDALVEEVPIEDLVSPVEAEGFHLLPSSVDLAGAERELERDLGWHVVLRDGLARVMGSYDYIVIDCPPSLGPLMISALVASDYFIIPIQAQVFSMHGIKQLMDTVRKVRERLGADVDLLGAVLTMVDWRTRLSRRVTARIEETFGEKMFRTKIRINTRLAEAPEYAASILTFDAKSRGAEDYRSLAKEVRARVGA
ncbi:MAG: AAA family ATPase [Actinomycetota bacterium]|nr:AAA family ATPase [Actinomycetota bacterium]